MAVEAYDQTKSYLFNNLSKMVPISNFVNIDFSHAQRRTDGGFTQALRRAKTAPLKIITHSTKFGAVD
jgi:hypothetical protein